MVAIRFGFASFDSFNRLLGHRIGSFVEDLECESECSFECTHEVPDADSFEKHGTGVVYIDGIRDENGSVWNADLSTIIENLREFDCNITLKDLKKITK